MNMLQFAPSLWSGPALANPMMPWDGGFASQRLLGSPAPMATGAPDMLGWETAMLSQLVGMLAMLMAGSATQTATTANQSGGSDASFNANGGQAADPSQFQGGTEMGRKLAAAALKESTDGDSKGGLCARDVGQALRDVGLGVDRGDAWTKAAVLARDPRFKEIKVAQNEIDRLPPGAIIVWDKGAGLPYGHISIALGDGREASDLLRKQMHLKTSYRVFMPI